MFGLFNKMDQSEELAKAQDEVATLENKVDRLEEELKSTRKDLKTVREANKDDKDEAAVTARRLERKTNEEITIREEKIANLERQLEHLGKLSGSATANEKKELELMRREAILESKEVNADNLAEKVKEYEAKGEEVAEKKYQAGYADGIADGLRKAHEITAEDRKAGMQIAALAAASHQPDATKQIAQAIAKDVSRALPTYSTTSRKK
jgi:chromosome segregation ATPase